MKGEKGFALVITLIVTALLIALVAEFVNEVYVDTTLRQSYVFGQQASIMAESGVSGGIKLLQVELGLKDYSSLNDKWAKPLQLEDEQGALEVVIEDEGGKLNINYLVPPSGEFDNNFYYGAAVRLLKKFGIPSERLDAVADWIDENEEPHPGGAETRYYSTMKPPYAAKNARFESIDELGMVKGFAGETLVRLKPFITVYAESQAAPAAPVNINTAPPEILLSLDERISEDLVKRVLDYRKATPFKNTGELARVPGMESISTGLQTRISTKSSVYRIRSQARVRETSRLVEAVVRISGSQSSVLYWREY